jgi:phosphatidylglycerophosphate synthase
MLDTWFNRAGSTTDASLTALARRLHDRGVSANALTYAGLGTGVLGGILFSLDHGWWAFAVILLSGLLDAVDGRVARLGSGPTAWGGVLDLTFDRIVEASVLLGIALPRPHLHGPGLILAVTWYVNLCVFLAVGAASAKHSEKVIQYPPGILERGEALVFAFVVVALPSWAAVAFYVYAALGIVTAAQRFRHGRRALSPHSRAGGPPL